MCRRFGEKLCDSPKCPVTKRNYPSGQHGPNKRRPKVSGYGQQLKEKQKAKWMYGLMERQFRKYVEEASRKTGDTGKFLLTYLESRLDNVVYRSGLAPSRAAARQLVGHGLITVNGKKVDIPSYRVRVGEVVGVKESKKNKKIFENKSQALQKMETPAWLALDANNLSVKMLNTPFNDNPNFNPRVIIEFYSR